MDTDLFTATFPHLYHMSAAGSWPSIQRDGLLSTSALLDAEGVEGSARCRIESERRPEAVVLPQSGRVIRDQRPMSDTLVARSLEGSGLAPSDWYRLLNSMVFFFAHEEGLARLLNARSYRDQEHDVLVVDSHSLISTHLDHVRLCAINSGATFLKPQPRGPDTFKPLAEYPFAQLARRRGSPAKAIAECCVIGQVPDISCHTRAVFRMKQGRRLRKIL
ncbi:MAG: hypothetical protein AAGI11_00005 [Pseudomonadota bacterium]